MSISTSQLLDLDQVTALLSLEAEDVHWLIDTNQLRYRQINNQTLVAREDVRRLLDAYKAVARRRRK